MKRRLLFISLALAVLTTTSLGAAALAANSVPFSASGTVSTISDGDVFPAGESGRWVVAERELTGTLSGDINGDFTMTYKANVELETQVGRLHGTLEVGSYLLKVNGEIESCTQVGVIYWEVAPGYWMDMPKLKLTLNGHFTFTKGAQGNGDFDAEVVFVPTLDGHVDTVFPDESAINMTGKWQPPN